MMLAGLLPGVVDVKYHGLLGNRLGQYCLGRFLASELGFHFFAPPIAGFSKTVCDGWRFLRYVPAREFQAVVGGHRLDMSSILANRRRRLVLVQGFFQRYEYFQPIKNIIRNDWLWTKPMRGGESDELVIHVRGGPDVWDSGIPSRRVHPQYPALPLSFYREIIDRQPWRRIVLVTNDPRDAMVTRISDDYGAVVRSESQMDDFRFLRGSRNIVLSVSTFSWWAAWLSAAERVFYPDAGLFDAKQSGQRLWEWQQDLWVSDEARYIRIRPRVPLENWRGLPEDRRRLLEG